VADDSEPRQLALRIFPAAIRILQQDLKTAVAEPATGFS
jgi:hypothetical protein